MDIDHIMFRLDDGLVDLLLQINSNVLKNHLIFSYAFSEFYDRYKKGRGRVNVANVKKVINYWIFYRNHLLVFPQRSLLI